MDYDFYDAVLQHLFKQTITDNPSGENVSTASGVCIRVDTGHFRVFPYENPLLAPFVEAVRSLDPVVAVKLRSAAVKAVLAAAGEDKTAIYVDSATKIQLLETMSCLSQADKEQCAAFIRDERVMIIWTDNLDSIIPICREFEDMLIKLVWGARPALHGAAK